MKKLFSALVLVIIGSIIISSCSQNNKTTEHVSGISKKESFMQTDGASILDTAGNPIVLKGTNIGNWLVPEGYMFKLKKAGSPRKIDELFHELIGPDSLVAFWDKYLDNYIRYEDIKYLKEIGCNHIRLPFNYKLFTDDLYMGKRNAGFTYFDRIIEWCKKEELYILLDMHCAPGGQTGANIDDSYGYPYLYYSKSSQDMLCNIWGDIATKYKDEPIVLGYDIINEPIAHYYNDSIDRLNHELHLLYKRVVSEIRNIDKDHMIFLGGSNWNTNFDCFEEIIDSNVVYEFHKYWMPVVQGEIYTYVHFRDSLDVPIYIGETGENTDEWVEDFRELLDSNNISWCFWPYKKMNNTKGIINFEQPENYHLISEYSSSERSSFKGIRENRPDITKVQKAFNEYLENCLFENNFQNKGYSKALDLQID